MATTMIADGVLIKHYTEGNQGAFETLLKRHKNRIFSSIYALVGDRYIAEDIFQETFIKIIHSIRTGKYNHEDKFLPWAMRISRNMCIDSIRQRKRLPIVVDSEGNDILNNLGNDEITMLRKWIWELPEEQREVLVLRNYADLSFKEIAVVTNTNINTCIGRMHYALINLRKMTQKNSVRVK